MKNIKKPKRKANRIEINEANCTGCLMCELWCSFVHHNVLNPSKANLRIEDSYGLSPKIVFLEDCYQCGQCVQHCLYGALNLKEETD